MVKFAVAIIMLVVPSIFSIVNYYNGSINIQYKQDMVYKLQTTYADSTLFLMKNFLFTTQQQSFSI
jgi:hypothetical protein